MRTVKELIEILSKFDENENVKCLIEMGQHRTTLYCDDGDFGIFRNSEGQLILDVSGDVDYED
tara:strand:- start:12 stop:200 length:189 start_codon:yes stop_codon:yes gene_type:complete